MTVTSIPITFTRGNIPSVAQWNAWGLALTSLLAGNTDDYDGGVIVPGCLAWPLPIVLADTNLSSKTWAMAATYTVPAGVAFVITHWKGLGGTVTITPSGQAGFTFSPGTGIEFACHVPLGPGDAIANASATISAVGFLVSTRPKVGPVVRSVTDTTTYTVPAGKVLIVTHLSGNYSYRQTLLRNLCCDGTPALPAWGTGPDETTVDGGPGSVAYDFRQMRLAFPVPSGTVLSSSSTTAITVAGYLVTQ